MKIDFESGRWEGAGLSCGTKTIGDLAPYYSATASDLEDLVVYETFGVQEAEPADAMMATTVLQAGLVGEEFFMTRGHFHVNPARGETCVILRGSGVLVLANRENEWRAEEMSRGSVHVIDGSWAHRVVNVGTEPLVFLVTWMSDCGHDYASIEAKGFPVRILSSGDSGYRIEPR